MLVQPRKYRLNEAPEEGKGTATVTFDSTPAESPYAAHDPRCKKLKDRTLDCFFLPLAACRASVATSSCEEDTREKLRAAYLKRWRYDAAGWKDVKHLGKKEQRGKLHSLELHMSLRTEGTMLGWLEKIPGYRVWTADEEETEEVDNIIQAYKKVTPTTISVRGAERVLQDYVHLGELWVFSQIMAYICRLRPSVAKVLRNHKLAKALRGRPYMAFHVRVTDNSGALWRTGLTPKIFEFAHFMTLAAKVRKTHPKMRTIYVAADKFHIDSAKAYTRHWDFIYNANADKKKSSTKEAIDDSEEIEYFLKNPHTMDVLLDLDIMKRADYMFGSMTSNFFRLASELNFAHHDDQQKRFFEVDRIPWETAEHG